MTQRHSMTRLGTVRSSGRAVREHAERPASAGPPSYCAWYIADAAPSQARGNNLNLNGGLWHDVPVSR